MIGARLAMRALSAAAILAGAAAGLAESNKFDRTIAFPRGGEVKLDWAYRRFDHLYGRYTYQGRPVHGFRVTPQGSPLDDYGRNVFLDTLDSRYGAGWRRENSFLAQRPNGAFCYGFYPHAGRPAGRGTQYRATVIGPGVAPDVTWEGEPPGPFSRARELQANAHQRQIFAGRNGNGCKPL